MPSRGASHGSACRSGVHEQGGLVGYTHLAWSPEFFRRKNPSLNPGWDASINVIRGKIDFIDILEAARLGFEDYYDFLNLGAKLTAMARAARQGAVREMGRRACGLRCVVRTIGRHGRGEVQVMEAVGCH